MAWARLNDNFFLDPKIIACDGEAKLLYIAGLTYCAGQLTDGHIPARAVPMIASMAGVANAQANAEALLNACLWQLAGDGGYLVCNYLKYNPSREKVDEVREARKQAGSKGGKASAGKPRIANAQANAQANEQQKASISPSHPHISSPTEKGAAAPAPVPIRQSQPRQFESVKAQRIAATAEAFKALGIKFPRLPEKDAKALGQLIEAGYSPETLAECWRDYRAKAYQGSDGFADGQLSFQFLAGYNRVGNWQEWCEAGRPSQARAAANGRHADANHDVPISEIPANWRAGR